MEVDLSLLLPTIAGAILNMIIGFFWYSPSLYGNTWVKLIGKNMDELKKGSNNAYLYVSLGSFIEAFVLANVLKQIGTRDLVSGALWGLLIWLGFVATTMAANYMFASRPQKLYLIDTGYHLVSLLVMGAVLGATI